MAMNYRISLKRFFYTLLGLIFLLNFASPLFAKLVANTTNYIRGSAPFFTAPSQPTMKNSVDFYATLAVEGKIYEGDSFTLIYNLSDPNDDIDSSITSVRWFCTPVSGSVYNFPLSYVTSDSRLNVGSSTLEIPTNASGCRIGVELSASTLYGDPNKGLPIKIDDISNNTSGGKSVNAVFPITFTPPGSIVGNPPTATISGLRVLYPDGIAVLQESDILSGSGKPSDYKIDVSLITMTDWFDPDSDLPDPVNPFVINDLPEPMLIWRHNGRVLTLSETKQSWSSLGLQGEHLTVEAVISVTLKSWFGVPNLNTIVVSKTWNVDIQ